ncbi:TonB-dependent receptor plug domain-containing protein [Psychromonas arctica]|uniref:TonB-dependent receptor plug domain-containing protein n=1 Tax=Psychromonas arctica TaxID=168275 RepID=UPI00040034E2|nr:TonB-dependent receptor [Psychromonas arctica]
MFTLRYTSIAVIALSICSANSLADDEITSSQTSPRKNILITKGFSAPNATTQNYSGENIVSIVPSDSDINKTLDQLIAENTPGFVHTNSGTAKHNASNYHRGLSDKYTLYLLNGVPFPTSTLGSQNIPTIPMESIALIEVIRGAQASLYGSSSLTGVINIITKTGDMADTQLNISAGSNNTKRVGAAYANNWNNFQFMTSFDRDQSDGYDFIEDSNDDFGYDAYSMNSYAAYVTETNRFSIAINNATSDLEIYESYPTVGKAKTSQDTLQITGKYIQQYTQNLSSEVTLSTAEVDLKAGHPDASNVDHYSTRENLFQLHLKGDWQGLTVNLGGEFIQSTYKSNENGNDRDQGAVYLAFSHYLTDYLNISGGIRHDHYSDFGDALTYSAGFSLFETASINYKTSFTAPSYNDLYWPGSGNPDLESEEGEILELSLTHDFDTQYAYIPLKLNFYTGSLDNKIQWAPISVGSWDWSPFNIGEVKIKGAELYTQYSANAYAFDIAVAYSESIDQDTNQQLDNVPKWSGSSSVEYYLTNKLKPKFTYTYVGKRTTSSDELQEVHLLSLAMTYQLNQHINLGVNLNNITDNDKQLHNGYNAEGRTVQFTIGAQL